MITSSAFRIYKCLIVLILALCITLPHSAQVLSEYHVVYADGIEIPGTDSDTTFQVAGGPVRLGQNGDLSFGGVIQGPTIINGSIESYGIWGTRDGLLQPILLGGDVISDGSGDLYEGTIQDIAVDNLGQVSFYGGINSQTGEHAVFSEYGKQINVVARSSFPAPVFGPNVLYKNLYSPSTGSNGQIAFGAILQGDGVDASNDWALLASDNGAIKSLVREGDHAPGTSADTTFARNLPYAVSNLAGEWIFTAGLSGPSVDSTNDGGIWHATSSGTSLLIRKGNPAPGLEPGTIFGSIPEPVSENPQGLPPFIIDLINPNGVVSRSAWVFRDGFPEMIARSGEKIPGGTSGELFEKFNSLETSHSGHVAFSAELSGPDVGSNNRYAIFTDARGALELLVQEGDQAPGMASGVVFTSAYWAIPNSIGQTVFSGNVSDRSRGIWFQDSDGEIELLVKVGDRIDINDDVAISEFKEIQNIRYATSQGITSDYVGRSFNDNSELAVDVRFTDGSVGVLVLVVPEPTTFAILSLAGLLVVRRRN